MAKQQFEQLYLQGVAECQPRPRPLAVGGPDRQEDQHSSPLYHSTETAGETRAGLDQPGEATAQLAPTKTAADKVNGVQIEIFQINFF